MADQKGGTRNTDPSDRPSSSRDKTMQPASARDLKPELDGSAVLPVTEFMYTLDQVAHLLNVQVSSLNVHVRFTGLNRAKPKSLVGKRDRRMKAISIIPSELHESPEWRVPTSEVERYLKGLNLVVYQRKYRP